MGRRRRTCAVCGVALSRGASARRRYCGDACRAVAYRDRRRADRIVAVGMVTARAELAGDAAAAATGLLCPVCGRAVLPGGVRRADAVYCSGRCRTRMWRSRRRSA